MIRNPEIRTYGDLIRVKKPTSQRGTCCVCHKWGDPTWQLSTRASICEVCARRKGAQVLGSIVKGERKAKSWVKNHPNLHSQPQFIAHLSGASTEFVRAEIERRRATILRLTSQIIEKGGKLDDEARELLALAQLDPRSK